MTGQRKYARWSRKVTTKTPVGHIEQTEYLNYREAEKRLVEAMRERGDAGVAGWLDHALNGTLGDLTPDGPS